LADVLGANFVGGEQAQEGRLAGGGFHGRAAAGSRARQCKPRRLRHSGFAGCFDGIDGGSAGGTDVIHNHHACAFTAEAFDAAAGAVGLLGLADQKALEQGSTGEREGAQRLPWRRLNDGSAPMVSPPDASASMWWASKSSSIACPVSRPLRHSMS